SSRKSSRVVTAVISTDGRLEEPEAPEALGAVPSRGREAFDAGLATSVSPLSRGVPTLRSVGRPSSLQKPRTALLLAGQKTWFLSGSTSTAGSKPAQQHARRRSTPLQRAEKRGKEDSCMPRHRSATVHNNGRPPSHGNDFRSQA